MSRCSRSRVGAEHTRLGMQGLIPGIYKHKHTGLDYHLNDSPLSLGLLLPDDITYRYNASWSTKYKSFCILCISAIKWDLSTF